MSLRPATRFVRATAWTTLGGVVGFTMGLLVAPERGKEVRRRLLYRLEHLADQLAALVEQVASSESDASEARRTGDALVADAQLRAERIRDDIDALLDEMRQTSPQP